MLEGLLGLCPVQIMAQEAADEVNGDGFFIAIWKDGQPIEIHGATKGVPVEESQYAMLLDLLADTVEAAARPQDYLLDDDLLPF